MQGEGHWSVFILPSSDHGLVGILNGKPLPNFDITIPRVDISDLVQGNNSLLLKTGSTLWNVVIPYWSKIKTAGAGPARTLSVLPKPQHYRIIGNVVIMPYRLVVVT
jgi:hypothetical protein